MLLPFTGRHVAWADPAQGQVHPDLYIEDPYAPHDTSGATARLGTSVGFLYGEPTIDVLAIGLTGAVGQRYGRFAVEAEGSYYTLQRRGIVQTSIGPADGDVSIGSAERLGMVARFDVIRLDSHVVGPNSMLSIYVEGGADVAWNQWSKLASNEDMRVVPENTKRVEGVAGFGLMLDHRLQEPIGFPHRIAWFLGWRLAMSPHQPISASVCRSNTVECSVVQMPDDGSTVDRSMLFDSSLMFTF